jgi:choline dehydrogenase-like flavoprotein
VDLAVLEAAEAVGHAWCPDYNAPRSSGVSPVASNHRKGRRVSTNDAYLAGARERPNLRIVGDALVDRVVLHEGRAEGVRVRVHGQWVEWRADEIVLAARAIGSPAILMRSGIGDATRLRSLGVEPVAHMPGVGINLKGHPRILLSLLLREQARCNPRAVRSLCCYVRFDSSAGCTNDLLLASVNWVPRGNQFGAIMAALMAPTSTGSVRLASPDPTVDPLIAFRLVSTAGDQLRLREAARHAFELARHDAMISVAEEIRAGTSGRAIEEVRDDGALDAWIADECSEFHHPTGTCKMGDPTEPDTVVDGSCRVLGFENLRVGDASIFPDIPRANTNLAAIMVGEHLAALIKSAAHATLAESDLLRTPRAP